MIFDGATKLGLMLRWVFAHLAGDRFPMEWRG